MKLITLFLPLLAAVAVSAATPYMDLVDEADKACAKGEWTAALNAIDAALEREPENPGNILLLSNKGMIQFNLGLDSLAVATLTEAHLRAPRSVTILSNRARVLASCGRDAEALADYAQVIRLDSLDVDAHFHHGLLALRHRDYYAARTDFDWLAQNHPDSPENNIAQATILCALGRYEEAIPYYNHIIDILPEPEYYGGRAYCHLMAGNLDDASADISRALELSPADGELYLYRAALNRMRFRPEDARADALRAVELGVDPARAEQFIR